MSHGPSLPSRCARVGLAATMALVWAGYRPGLTVGAVDPVDPKVRARAAHVAQLGKQIDAVGVAGRAIPRETFDFGAIVTTVGKDPAALAKWVREQTAWVPYDGALRGGRGALMDRLGNSADRALLLGELLRAAGVPARVAHAPLDAATADLLAAAQPPMPAKLPAALTAYEDADPEPTLTAVAAQCGLDATALRQAGQRQTLVADGQAESIAQRVKVAAPALATALSGVPPVARNAEHEHWWVQYRAGDRWTDVDLMTPDGAPPRHADPVATTQPADPALTAHFAVEPARSQTVVIRVVTERWEAGKLTEETALSATLKPAELLGKRVSLSHSWLHADTTFDYDHPDHAEQQMRLAATTETEWMPVLTVGDAQQFRASLRSDGTINPKPDLDALVATGKSAAAAAKRAVDLLNSDTPAPAVQVRPESSLSAEWIEYHLTAPGHPDRVIRRQLFDLVGPAARAADGAIARPPNDDAAKLRRNLPLMGDVEMLLQPCRLSNAYVALIAADHALGARNRLQALASLDPEAGTSAMAPILEASSPGPGLLYNLALARQQWSPVQADVYLDAPTVLTRHTWMAVDGDGHFAAASAFDIVFNGVAVRPGAPPATAVQQGVVDTVAEAVIAATDASSAPRNVAISYAAAVAQGQSWVTLHGLADPALAKVTLPADARQRVAAALAAGLWVVLPASPVEGQPPEWWTYDPATGQTLGIGEQGWGPSAAEYVMIVRIMFQVASSFKCIMGSKGSSGKALGCVVLFVLGTASIAIGGPTGDIISGVAEGGSLLM